MKRNAGILAVVIVLAAVLLVGVASAQIVVMEGKNANVKHTFYNSVNNSAVFRFAEQEPMVFITKNGNITIELIDWGKDASKNAILVKVKYQNQSTLIPLERGVRGMQVAEMKLAPKVSLTVGLTHLFLGSPTRYAKISSSLWVLE
jgi:hypothetical protein